MEQKVRSEKMEESGGDRILQEDLDLVAASDIDLELYRDKAVFVTGATGLVGSWLVRCLLCCNRKKRLNLRIVAAVRNEKKAEQIYGDLLNRAELELYVGDITEPVQYEGRIDYIFHTASETTSKNMVAFPVETIETAYTGTKNILEFARKQQTEGVVYVSSMEVYGRPDAELASVSEKSLGYIDIGNVRSSYPEGKRICECLCNAYAVEYGVSVSSARLAQTFGSGVLKSDNRVYMQFAKSAMQKKDIVLHTEGKSEGNYCYIRDVVKALLLLGVKGEAGEAYNIVNEDSHMQIREMANLVADELCHGEIKVVYDIPESAAAYGYAPAVKMKLNGSKMRDLGWKPEVGLLETYQRMVGSIECR